MRDGRPVFDADMHVQEPVAVWTDHLDPAFRDRVTVHAGGLMPSFDAEPVFVVPSERRRPELRPTAMTDRYGELAERGFDPPATLEAMDVEGVDVAAMFPSYGLYVPWSDHHEPAFAVGLARAYNRWIVEFCAAGAGRLVPVGVAPLHDPGLAAAEARRAVTAGIRALMVRPNPVQGRPLSHPSHDVFFATVEELGVPVALHEGTGANVATSGYDRQSSWYGRHVASHPIEMMLAFESLVLDGVLERHPDLRIGLFESGTGWLPWWLHRFDEHHELLGASEYPELSLRPSEYFARQCTISTESDDAFAGSTVAAVGADHVVWASDFPHPEAAWPHAVEEFLEASALDAPALDAVLWDTPVRFFGLAGDELPRGPDVPHEAAGAAGRSRPR